jgi:hypothetical protein
VSRVGAARRFLEKIWKPPRKVARPALTTAPAQPVTAAVTTEMSAVAESDGEIRMVPLLRYGTRFASSQSMMP